MAQAAFRAQLSAGGHAVDPGAGGGGRRARPGLRPPRWLRPRGWCWRSRNALSCRLRQKGAGGGAGLNWGPTSVVPVVDGEPIENGLDGGSGGTHHW